MSNIPADQARSFRTALGAFATGVTVVTTRSSEGIDIGLTANSFNSVSLDPPMVLWSLAKRSRALEIFMNAEYFAVHVLAAGQESLSVRFSKPGENKFADLSIERGVGQTPLLHECAARFQCRTAFRYEGGDHVIFVGQVEQFDHSNHPALVYHSGTYALTVKTANEVSLAQSSEPDSSFSADFLIYLLERAHHQLFLQMRRELDRHHLSEAGWFVLSLLGVTNNRKLQELQQLLAYTGHEITYDVLAGLAVAGYVQLHGYHDPLARVELTAFGRAVVIELVSAAKAVEVHAARNLGPGESKVLKQALRLIVRDSDPGRDPLDSPTGPAEEIE